MNLVPLILVGKWTVFEFCLKVIAAFAGLFEFVDESAVGVVAAFHRVILPAYFGAGLPTVVFASLSRSSACPRVALRSFPRVV